MAHESFEDDEVAALLNRHFVSVKVDKEERPDIDSIYMAVCQAFTGSGGWPTTILMTPEQQPFFAGTYFPKTARYGTPGLLDLLLTVSERWQKDQAGLLRLAGQVVTQLQQSNDVTGEIEPSLPDSAVALFKKSFDAQWGGFGSAPKFPTPHNLLFLLEYYRKGGDAQVLEMAETTLLQMYRGGIYDHIGYGFSRYSTDRYFLAPHFEKMLYDNALLILAYSSAHSLTGKPLYREIAEKTAAYILREMTGPEGGFYCAQDADSDGVEGKYYVFTPQEILRVLGKDAGARFNHAYDITEAGNFEGKSIPNLLHNPEPDAALESCLPMLYRYRRNRARLHLDDKILTAWNGMMIAALALLYRVSGNQTYLHAARRAEQFVRGTLCEGDTLFVGCRDGQRGGKGFLDDYAFYVYALLGLYEATLDKNYLAEAQRLCRVAVELFSDTTDGGFYLGGKQNERLILRPKETYDGAIPSGNAVMAHNLALLFAITGEEAWGSLAEKQLAFLCAQAKDYPAGHCFGLLALGLYLDPPAHITVVAAGVVDRRALYAKHGLHAVVTLLDTPTAEYPLLNGKTTYYVCKNHSCMPPSNEI